MSTYGKRKEKKLQPNDMVMNCQEVKDELEQFVDEENKRVNVDSAKKRAVLYGMDYDGFRQMVLGANLFTIKSKDLIKFSAGDDQKPQNILNPNTITFNNVIDLQCKHQKDIENTNMLIVQQMQHNEMISTNFREFRKKFDKYYQQELNDESTNNIYMLIKSQNQESLKKIFSLDFDVQYFMKIIAVLEYAIEKFISPLKNQSEGQFIISFLKELTTIKDFQFTIPGFLNKSEKIKLSKFIDFLEVQFEYFLNEQIEDFKLIKSYYTKINQ